MLCMFNLFDFLIRLNLLSPFDRRRNICSSNGSSKQTASKDEKDANHKKKKSGKNCYKKTDRYVTEFIYILNVFDPMMVASLS